MKTWKTAKEAYISDHLSKRLSQPERRLNALKAIETVIQSSAPRLLEGDSVFRLYDKDKFLIQYESWKRKPLSSAEKSVIFGMWKFSK